jgi:hypothetical protein
MLYGIWESLSFPKVYPTMSSFQTYKQYKQMHYKHPKDVKNTFKTNVIWGEPIKAIDPIYAFAHVCFITQTLETHNSTNLYPDIFMFSKLESTYLKLLHYVFFIHKA